MLSFGAVSAQTTVDTYAPLTATGFTDDVIANGTGLPSTTSSIGVDNAQHVFFTTDYQNTATSPTYSYGLPVSGLITSAANSAVTYKLASYNTNNSLRLQTTNATGTLALSGMPANALALKELNILATGGSGAVTFSCVITFSDGSVQNATGSVGDWSSGTGTVVLTNFGKVGRTDLVVVNTSGTPKLFQTVITIDKANQAKTLSSISFTKTSTAEGTLNVFAVTATVGACAAPATPTADSQIFCTSSTVANLKNNGLISGATAVWYDSLGSTTPLAATTPLATGVYYIAQKVNTCESNRWLVNVIVADLKAPTVDAAQAFCNATTVGYLKASGVEGAVFKWYTTIGGTVLSKTAPLVNGTYYVTQSLSGCVSEAAAVVVSLSDTEAPKSVNQSFCGGATVANLTSEITTGAAKHWYDANGKALAEDTLLTTGIYFVSQTLGGCESTQTGIRVTVTARPDAPSGETAQNFTDGQTLADLDVTFLDNETAKWYIKTAEGNYGIVDADTVLEDGKTYYASQTSNSCESDYLAVTVKRVLATGSVTFKNLTVYPNPATDVLNISNNQAISQISVNNLLGQKVIDLKANGNAVQVNIAPLPAGTYIMQIVAQGAVTTVKVIKQ